NVLAYGWMPMTDKANARSLGHIDTAICRLLSRITPRLAERAVAFYNKRGTCEQWIKEGKRDPLDAAVMPDVSRQRRLAPASCARLQSRRFLAHTGDARADQELVADQPEGKAGQDRREGREPRPLCHLPDGRGCHATANDPGDIAAHRGTAAAATTRTSMRCSTIMRSTATDRKSASECQGNWPDQILDRHSDA